MARASAAAENAALEGLDHGGGATSIIGFVSLHTADPGTTGVSEASGSGYARQACTWATASGGSKASSTAMTFSTNGTTPITHFGTWTLSSAGAYSIGGLLTASVTAASITVASAALTIAAA